MHFRRIIPVVTLALAVPTIAAFPIANHVQAASQHAAMTGKVAFLMSDFTTSARWQSDRKFFIQEMKKLDPGIQVVVYDAKNAQTNQQNQAKAALTAGAKLLVDVPVDSAQAAAIVREAHNNKPRVPVIAYDRLITGAFEDAYASFDGYSVGVKQGKFLQAHVAKGGTIVSIAGAPTDNNAHLFYSGAMSVLRPLFASHYFKLGYDKFTPNWDAATAQQEMASALNQLNNKVNGVLSANDGMAGGIVTALAAQKLAGKVVVTGQDGTIAGLQQICLGNQSMTVYKPYRVLAQKTAHIADILLHHKGYHSGIRTQTGAGGTPTSLTNVVTVTKSNIASTEIADGFVKKSDVPQCHL